MKPSTNKKKLENGHSPRMLLNENTPFAIAEAYKSLRTNLTFALVATDQDQPHRNAIVVTSSVPNEGKSITSSNIAISFGQTGSRTLLIDADMRKPVQHRMFELNNDVGLSSVLLKLDTLATSIHHNVRPGLDVITSGEIPPTPSELLGSQAMSKLLDIVCQVYDYVIIDTPPVNIVTDALTFSRNTAGILLTVRQSVCLHKDLKRSVENIRLSDSNILGTVLSDVDNGAGGTGYRYRYSSRYYNYYNQYVYAASASKSKSPDSKSSDSDQKNIK